MQIQSDEKYINGKLLYFSQGLLNIKIRNTEPS